MITTKKRKKEPKNSKSKKPKSSTPTCSAVKLERDTKPKFPSLFSLALTSLYNQNNNKFSKIQEISPTQIQKVENIVESVFSWDLKKRNSIPHLAKLITSLFPYLNKLNLTEKIVDFDELKYCTVLEQIDLSYTMISDSQLKQIIQSNPRLHVCTD